MAPYLGDFVEDAALHFMWSTNDSDGASITRSTDGEVRVYKDNGVGQSTAGVTDTEDFDSLVGIHVCTIDLSADAFYAVGANYTVVLQGATIDGQTVNAVLAHFSIENRVMRGTDSALLAASAPTNFSDLAITVTTGLVDVNGKTGFSLASTGLDAISQAATGMVEIAKAIWDRVLTGATHNIATSAGRRLRGIQEFQGYANGAIWIDTVDGVAGTTDFENGTVENPVDSIADANTLAASLGIERFEVAPGSSITFGASQNNQTFSGHNWALALGGRDIAGSGFFGATVSGIASGIGTLQIFDKCILNAMSHIKGTHLIECGIAGTQTIVEAGDFFADRCHSAIAGTATPVWDFGGALNASNLSFRNYSGGIEIQNMGAGTGSYAMSLEGRGQLVINANCSATSSVAIRGLFTVTDNASGAVTLSDVARFAEDQSVTTVTGNVNGSVGSVTGNVGGDVQGNVDGSVASVVGNIGGDVQGNVDGSVASVTTVNDKTGYSIGSGGITNLSFAASAITAASFATDTGQEIADRILARNIEGGSDTGRTVGEAFARLRNRVRNNAGTFEVYDITDASILWSGVLTTSAAVDPATELNPA